MGYLLYAEEIALANVEPEPVNIGLGLTIAERIGASLRRVPARPDAWTRSMLARRAEEAAAARAAALEAERKRHEAARAAHLAARTARRTAQGEVFKARLAARGIDYANLVARRAAWQAARGERRAALHAARVAFLQRPGRAVPLLIAPGTGLQTTGLTGLDGRAILQDAEHYYVPVSGPFEPSLGGEAEYVWIGSAPHLGELGGWFKKLRKKVKKVVKKIAKGVKKVVKAVKKPLVGGLLIAGGIVAGATGVGLPIAGALVGSGVGVIAKKGTGFGKPLELLKRAAIGAGAGAAAGWLVGGGAALIGSKVVSGGKLAMAGLKAVGGKLFGPKGEAVSDREAQDMMRELPDDSPQQQAAAFDWSKIPVGLAIALGGVLFAKGTDGQVAQVAEPGTGESILPTGGEITYPTGGAIPSGGGIPGYAAPEAAPEYEGAPVAAAPAAAGVGGGAAAAVIVGGLALLALARR